MADLSLVRSQDTTLAPTGFVRFDGIKDAIDFAQFIAKSDLVPKAYQGKPADIVIAMQMGMELGFSPLQALQSIAVINGKPGIYGDGIPALIIGQPECEDFHEVEPQGEEPTQWVATCTITRRGKSPVVRTFSYADAKKAGLWGKSGPWTNYPKRMLTMRARGFAARDAFPDKLKGIISAEEAADYPTSSPSHVSEPKRVGSGSSAQVVPLAPAQTVPAVEAAAAPVESPAPIPVAAPAPVTLPKDECLVGVSVLNSVFSRDKQDKPVYEFATSEGLFVSRDHGVYTTLAGIEGTDHTATIAFTIGRKGGQSVRVAKSASVDEPVDSTPIEGEVIA